MDDFTRKALDVLYGLGDSPETPGCVRYILPTGRKIELAGRIADALREVAAAAKAEVQQVQVESADPQLDRFRRSAEDRIQYVARIIEHHVRHGRCVLVLPKRAATGEAFGVHVETIW